MDINVIIQFISTLGFPIACCVYLFWKDNKTEQRHYAEVEQVREAINNNTLVINTLVERLGAVDKANHSIAEALSAQMEVMKESKASK